MLIPDLEFFGPFWGDSLILKTTIFLVDDFHQLHLFRDAAPQSSRCSETKTSGESAGLAPEIRPY